MDEPYVGIESVLAFQCPRCGEVQRDEFEVVDLDVPTDWRCASCGRIFNVLVIDCPSCAAETAVVALAVSEHVLSRGFTCCHCGKTRCCDEEDEREDSKP
jgi:transposase-like protein